MATWGQQNKQKTHKLAKIIGNLHIGYQNFFFAKYNTLNTAEYQVNKSGENQLKHTTLLKYTEIVCIEELVILWWTSFPLCHVISPITNMKILICQVEIQW